VKCIHYFHEQDVHNVKFRKNSKSERISQYWCPVHEIIDFTKWMRHILQAARYPSRNNMWNVRLLLFCNASFFFYDFQKQTTNPVIFRLGSYFTHLFMC